MTEYVFEKDGLVTEYATNDGGARVTSSTIIFKEREPESIESRDDVDSYTEHYLPLTETREGPSLDTREESENIRNCGNSVAQNRDPPSSDIHGKGPSYTDIRDPPCRNSYSTYRRIPSIAGSRDPPARVNE